MIRISNVNYINTLPYSQTFEESDFIQNNALVKGQNPSGCVVELMNNDADIGLVPVGALGMLPDFKIIEGYGICAHKQVDSVLILSDVPLNELSKVYLDYQSKSSNGFVKILEKNYWKHGIEFLESESGYEKNISGTTGGLVIGDRALKLKHDFKYRTDVAYEWYRFASLPAVFAVWVANSIVDDTFLSKFRDVLESTVINKRAIAEKFASEYLHFDLPDYIGNKIAYRIGKAELESMKLYQKLLEEIQ